MSPKRPQAPDARERELDTYQSMREFSATPEPEGAVAPSPDGRLRFVIQEHHATSMHWDVRLEREGVLVSWAVPRGVPPDPKVNHLAVQTEDHPMQYLTFHGEIPEGNYGAGQMTVWDTGTYECEKWNDREVVVVFHGERARGRYVFFRTRGKDWMLHRMDPAEDPTREEIPERVDLAVIPSGRPPKDPTAWQFEPDVGGERVAVRSWGGRALIHRAEDWEDVTALFPELREFGRALGAAQVVLDGQLAGEDVARRLAAPNPNAARRLATSHPVAFVASDVVWLEGHSTVSLATTDRRRLLDDLGISGPGWQTVIAVAGQLDILRPAVAAQGLPAIVAKPLTASYGERWRRLSV